MKWPVRVEHQCIQADANHRLVAAVILESFLDLFLQAAIGLTEHRVHFHRHNLFGIGWQLRRNVLKRDERPHAHQESAKQQRRGSGSAPHAFFHSSFRTGILYGFDDRDLLQDAVSFRERADTRFPMLETLRNHFPGFESEEDVKEFVCVSTQQGSGQDGNAVRTNSESCERIALRGIAL